MTTTPMQRVCHRFRAALTESSESDAGFTLVEVLVAFTVLVIISVSAIAAIVSMVRVSSDTEFRVTAANVAQQDLAQQRAITDRTQVASTPIVNGQPSTLTRLVGNRTFYLTRTVTGTCLKGHDKNYNPVWIDVTDTVTWPGTSTGVVVGTRLAC